MQTSDAMRREIAAAHSVRSPDERSEIRDRSNTAPDIASLIRATSGARTVGWVERSETHHCIPQHQQR